MPHELCRSCMLYHIILNNVILKLSSSVLPSIEENISEYTLEGVYKLVVNEINKVIIRLSLMIVKTRRG